MIRVGLIGFLLLTWTSPLQAGEKWALLIGVDDYIKGSDSRDLRGCENDVLMTREVLTTKFVFPEQNIRTLLSTEATTQNIIRAIEDWLIGKTQPEDIVYLHFSGHGSQTDDRNGDEDDGKDELICPSDVESRDINTVITDDQLRGLLDRIPSRNVTVVLDACHSGTGTRDLALSRPRFIDFEVYEGGEREGSRAVVMTGIDPQAPLQQDAYDQQESPVSDEMPSQNKLEAPAGSAGMESGSQLRVTISGCQPDQTSADAWIRDDLYAGALTYHLVENMKKAPTDITYRELMERVVRDIKGAKYSQTPQIEGDMDRPLFGTEIPDAVSVPFAVIRSVRDNTVTLRVGTVQNVTVGSIYAVFPAEETAFEGTGLGRIKIVKVGRTSSEAMVLEGGRIRPGYRAREILHHFGTDTLKLLLEVGAPTVRRDIQRTMASIGFVEIVEPGKHFDQRLLVRISVDGLLGALTFDGVPDEWIDAPDAAGLVSALRPHLENSYAMKHLANLDNPAPPFQVSVAVFVLVVVALVFKSVVTVVVVVIVVVTVSWSARWLT